MKPYTFNNEQFNDLNSLALSYIENFELAVNDIYDNSNKLFAFFKQNVKNKERYQIFRDNLAYSKYRNNALTFMIYEFLENKKIIINGQDLSSFNDFITLLKNHGDDKENNVLFAFLEDHGITRCYERLEPNNPFFKDAYYVESNCYNDFTYEYLTTLGEFKVTEAYEKKLTSIALANEECFRRASKVASLPEFKLYVAHKYGFKAAIEMEKSRNPLFAALKLMKAEMEDEMVKRIVSGTFYWWMMENYTKYEFNGKSKNVRTKFNDIKADLNKEESKAKKGKADAMSLDYFITISERIYDAYLDMVYYFKEGSVTVNKGENVPEYELDKPYCKTFITAGYMKGKVVKLYVKQEVTTTINPLTGEEIPAEATTPKDDMDDVTGDEPVEYHTEVASDKKIEKAKKIMAANTRNCSSAVVLAVIGIALCILGIILSTLDKNTLVFANIAAFTTPYAFFGLAAGVFTMVLAVINLVLVSKREQAFEDYKFINQSAKKDILTLAQEEKLFKLKKNEDQIMKRITKNNIVLPAIQELFLGGMVAITSYLLAAVLLGLLFQKSYSPLLGNSIYLLATITGSTALGLIFGLIFRKKGVLLNLLMLLIGIGLSVGLAIVLGM